MINDDNYKFMSKYGSKNAILDFIKTADYSPRYHTDRMNNNPFADPSIVDAVRKISPRYTPSFHSYRLYDPSPEMESKAVSDYHDATAYFNHPKHTEDDLIRIYDKNPSIYIQSKSVGAKFIKHLASKKDHQGLYDSIMTSSRTDAHDAAMDHIITEPIKMKSDALKCSLASNEHLSKENQSKIYKSTNHPDVIENLVRNPNLDPDLALDIVKKHKHLHDLFKIHKKNKIQKYMSAFEEIKKANRNQDDQ